MGRCHGDDMDTKKAEKSIDELTKKFSDRIDELFKAKSAEIMAI